MSSENWRSWKLLPGSLRVFLYRDLQTDRGMLIPHSGLLAASQLWARTRYSYFNTVLGFSWLGQQALMSRQNCFFSEVPQFELLLSQTLKMKFSPFVTVSQIQSLSFLLRIRSKCSKNIILTYLRVWQKARPQELFTTDCSYTENHSGFTKHISKGMSDNRRVESLLHSNRKFTYCRISRSPGYLSVELWFNTEVLEPEK